MNSIRFFLVILKILCRIHHSLGLLRTYFDRPTQKYYTRGSCCHCLLPLLMILASLIQQFLGSASDFSNAQYNEIVPGAKPIRTQYEIQCEILNDAMVVWLVLCCLMRKRCLWRVMDQAQLAYKKLVPLLKRLKCSKWLLLLDVPLIASLLLVLLKIAWHDWPGLEQQDKINVKMYKFWKYAMGFKSLLYCLIMLLHIHYHLILAALLQALNSQLRSVKKLSEKLKKLNHFLSVLPNFKRMNYWASCYFKYYFFWYMIFLVNKCFAFVATFTYTEKVVLQMLKQEYDVEDEALWAGEDTVPRAQLVRNAALALAGYLTMLLILMAAAFVHQHEICNLTNYCWELHEQADEMNSELNMPSTSTNSNNVLREENAPIRIFINKNDVITFLLETSLNIVDYRARSIAFFAFGSKSIISLDAIAGGLKMIFQLIIFSAILDFITRQDLASFAIYCKENH